MFTPLARSFYEPSAKVVASRLLGHWLIRRTEEGYAGGPIVETEAYLKGDPASHSFKGETARNRAMWGPPGHAYVYLIYGFYYCFNTVCQPHGHAEAVLVRAIEATWGADWMKQNRPVEKVQALTSGPGKLCVALNIGRDLDGVDICDANSPLFIAANPDVKLYRRQAGPLVTTTRVGINVAADWPLRFYLEGSPFISKRAARLKPVP